VENEYPYINGGPLLDDKLWRMNIRIHGGALLDDKLCGTKDLLWMTNYNLALITNTPYTKREKNRVWGGWGGPRLIIIIIIRHATQVPTMCYFLLFFPHDWQ
jgi:hypothetical protein